jgi:hypothetical protein
MIQPEINQWKQKLEHVLASSRDRDPEDLFKDLRDLGAALGDDAADALLESYPDLFGFSRTLADLNHQRVIARDIAETKRLLRKDLTGPVLFGDVADRTTSVNFNRSDDMFSRLKRDDCRRLVMVGCGRLPFTMFNVHDKTEIPEIVGLDILPEAIEIASRLARRLGYERVKTELRDGRSYDYSNTQIVYIAAIVSPKSAVISRIGDTAPEGVRIVVREPYSLARMWLESIEQSLDPRFEVTGMGTKSPNMNRDVYLRRRAVPQSSTQAS